MSQFTEFVQVLQRNLTNVKPVLAKALAYEYVRCAKQFQTFNNLDCNYGLTDAQETRRTQLAGYVFELCEALGFGAVLHRDPRGAALKLGFPDKTTNDWAQEGYCVPTSTR